MSYKLQITQTNWLRVFMDALRGRTGNPTEGPIVPAIIALAVPMVLEMVMESLFAVVNIFWVARLGAAATAAIGLTESLLAMIYTVAMGLSIGVMAVVARRMGERDEEGASDAAFQTIVLGLAISIVLGIVGGVSAKSLLRVMGADAEVLRVGSMYATIMLSSNGVILLLFLLNAAFRGAADAEIAMRVLWIANIINMILDPLLIFGIGPFPELGVTGTAIATTIGRGTGVLIQLLVLFSGSGRLKLAARHVKLHVEVMLRVLRLSGTGTLQVFIATASWIGLIRVLSTFGSDALAGYTIAIRIVLFALLPAWGLANAAATMVGQSLGAQKPDRAEQAVWIAGAINLVFLGSVGIVFMAAAPFITSLFGGDAATTIYAIRCLRIVSAGFFFYAYGMVISNSFNGAGDTWTPTLLNLFCFWLFEIPMAWALSRMLDFGPTGVFTAIMVAFSVFAVAAAVLWRRGKWKLAVV
jgi:putative MATE family efflux protein